MATDQEKKLVDDQINLIKDYLKEGGQAGDLMNVMFFTMDQAICGISSGWEGQTFIYEHCTFTLTPVDAEKVDGEE